MSTFGVAAAANPWVRVLDALEKKINRTSYETWLKPTRFDHSQGPHSFCPRPQSGVLPHRERYGDLISEAIENLGLEFRDVEFVSDEPHRARLPKVRPLPRRRSRVHLLPITLSSVESPSSASIGMEQRN